jgi:hypothetical protein
MNVTCLTIVGVLLCGFFLFVVYCDNNDNFWR